MCYGVRQAMGQINDLLSDNVPAYYAHKLIHNDLVIRKLEARGLTYLPNASEPVSCGQAYFIGSAHGLGCFSREKYQKMGFSVFSTTCSRVLEFQRTAQDLLRRGYDLVILGDAEHREIEALREYLERIKEVEGLGSSYSVIADPEDALSLTSLSKKVAIVGQTTTVRFKFEQAVHHLQSMSYEIKVVSTLCSSVEKRVEAAKAMAQKVSVMVVVGSLSISRNTKGLYEAILPFCSKVVAVECANDLQPDDFASLHSIGVTAGASVDEETLREVVERLKTI